MESDNSFQFIRGMNDLILGRKGGRTTVKIIDEILRHPYNANQLSKELDLDYKTVKYHIYLVLKSEVVVENEMQYGTLFYPSQKLINNLSEYEQIKNNLK